MLEQAVGIGLHNSDYVYIYVNYQPKEMRELMQNKIGLVGIGLGTRSSSELEGTVNFVFFLLFALFK